MKRLSVLLLLFLVGSASAESVEGVWRGTLAKRLRLVLVISKAPDGSLSGTLESVDQGATLPIDKMTAAADKLQFDIPSVAGGFVATLTHDELRGTWTQGGAGQPLIFTRDKVAKLTGPAPLEAPIDVNVPMAPTAFHAQGKLNLVYELHITNFGRRPIDLSKIEILDGKTELAHYEQQELVTQVERPGVPDVGLAKLRIGPGLIAVVFVWLAVDAAPVIITHRITVDENLAVTCAKVAVQKEVTSIAAPLVGAGWKAMNGPSNGSIHRRALLPVSGRAHLAQRFAIDYVKVGSDGKTLTGDPKVNASYHAYGAQAVAVADGVISEIKDGIAENTPGPPPPGTSLEAAAGNHVVLDLGKGRYALYAHLQPKSLKVKAGDHVKRGQALGLVGNSGNTSEPHLHFHLSDGNSPLASEGIPYALDYTDAAGKKHQAELPTENEMVGF